MSSNLNPALAARLSPDTVSMIERVEEWHAGNDPDTLTITFETLFDAVACTSLDDTTVDTRMAARPCATTGKIVWARSTDHQPERCPQHPATHRHIIYTATNTPGEGR